MCGITGFLDYGNSLTVQDLESMNNSIEHRGPDASGAQVFKMPFAQVGLGHRRLSILDLSELGNQPMIVEGLAIVFNGEIYNFQEIRNELILKGHSFRSNTDTEVILRAYQEWGMDALGRFIGMFAFALFDEKNARFFLVRDRVGVKPLYIYEGSDILLFGSELKPFLKNPGFEGILDFDCLAEFLKLSYIPTPHCIYKNTRKLEPGCFLEIDLKTRKSVQRRYWNVYEHYNKPLLEISYSEALEKMHETLISAFNYRMVSDVPVGVFLSGGYDSTAVASIIQAHSSESVKTFTIGYREAAYDESKEAAEISKHLGTDHTELICTPDDVSGVLEDLPHIYDEPFADTSVVPTLLVSRLARKKVTVALSGDGGDEIFAGYHKFEQSLRLTQKLPKSIQKAIGSLMSHVDPTNIPFASGLYNFSTRFDKIAETWRHSDAYVAMRQISDFITNRELNKMLVRPYQLKHTSFDDGPLLNPSDKLNGLLAMDYRTFLIDNNLVKIDRASMSVGLEGREPFLDHRVVELAARLPGAFKLRNGQTKALLKDIVHKYIPEELMDRPKAPFIAPLKLWMKDELQSVLIDLVNEDSLKAQNIFDPHSVVQMRDDYLRDGKVSNQKMWNVLIFQLWYNTYKGYLSS